MGDELADANETWERVFGTPVPELTSDGRRIVARFMHDIWLRPGLSMRERRLVTIATILMSVAGNPLRLHLRAALASGDLDQDDVEELALQLAMYGGLPRANMLREALAQVRLEDEAGDGQS